MTMKSPELNISPLLKVRNCRICDFFIAMEEKMIKVGDGHGFVHSSRATTYEGCNKPQTIVDHLI